MDGRFVVTGGGGFIGLNLCARLLNAGFEVVCVDSFITSERTQADQLQLRHAGFRIIEQSVTQPIIVDEPVQAVLHLASPASPPDYLKHPRVTLLAGSVGTDNAIALAQRKGAKFLLASTSEVYGDPGRRPVDESYWGYVNPIGPRSVYDEAKRFAEALTILEHRQSSLDSRIARIFNTYGPGMRPNDGRAIPNFISQALRGERLTIYGDGLQTRSLCYVDDLVEGIWRLVQAPGDTPAIHEPVNLGNPEERSVREIAMMVGRLVNGSDPVLEFHPLPQDDPTHRCPDIRKARGLLRWEPTTSLTVGLERTIEYFRTKGTGKADKSNY